MDAAGSGPGCGRVCGGCGAWMDGSAQHRDDPDTPGHRCAPGWFRWSGAGSRAFATTPGCALMCPAGSWRAATFPAMSCRTSPLMPCRVIPPAGRPGDVLPHLAAHALLCLCAGRRPVLRRLPLPSFPSRPCRVVSLLASAWRAAARRVLTGVLCQQERTGAGVRSRDAGECTRGAAFRLTGMPLARDVREPIPVGRGVVGSAPSFQAARSLGSPDPEQHVRTGCRTWLCTHRRPVPTRAHRCGRDVTGHRYVYARLGATSRPVPSPPRIRPCHPSHPVPATRPRPTSCRDPAARAPPTRRSARDPSR